MTKKCRSRFDFYIYEKIKGLITAFGGPNSYVYKM